jgi:hypothetical protein
MITKASITSQTRPNLKFSQRSATLLIITLLVAAGLRLWYGSFVIDDAYITFRYSRNLARGLGLVYNPDGRHILGTTTPLFTLLLGLFHWLGFSLEGVSLWLSILSDCATIILLYLFGRKLGLPYVGLVAGGLVALWPDFIDYATSGMETSLYTALLVGACYAYLNKAYGLTGLLLALLVLTRPDGLILVAVLFGHYLLKERRLPWRMGLVFLPLPLVWAGFATLYFGTPVSQSVTSKAAQTDTTPVESFIQLLIFLLQSVKPLLTILALFGIFAILRTSDFKLLRLPLGWWGLYSLLFVWMGAFHLFPWYYIPLLPFYFLFAVVGLVALAKPFARALKTAAAHRLARSGVIAAAVVAAIGLLVLALVHRQTLAETQLDRERLYQELATRYLNNLTPRDQVATKEIGTLGYFCDCQLYDLAGLVTPEVIKQPEMKLLQETRPAYIIVYNNLLRPETLSSDWLKQNYDTLEQRPVKVFGQDELYVFRRKDFPSA